MQINVAPWFSTVFKQFQDNFRDTETKSLNADEGFLIALDFTDNPRLFPKDIWKNTSLPVVVTYIFDGQESQAIGFIFSVSKVLPNNTILVYNMGLSDSGLKLVSHIAQNILFLKQINVCYYCISLNHICCLKIV